MTLPDKIKALPLPDPLWPERGRERAYRDAFSASQMRALLDAAATLAAEHEARAQALADALKLVAAQDQGCGGTVTETEAWRSAQSIARAALRAWKESQ